MMKNQRNLQISMLVLLFILILCSQFLLIFVETNAEQTNALDQKLASLAETSNLFLEGEQLHSNLDATSQDPLTEKTLAFSLGHLAQLLDVAYIYSVVEDGNKIRFVSSSPLAEEMAGEADYEYIYWTTYDEADQALLDSFASGEAGFSEYTDRWGTFRSIFLPKTAEDGQRYIVGVDVEINAVRTITQESLWSAFKQTVLFFAFCVPFVAYGVRTTQDMWRRKEENLLRDELTGLPNKKALIEDIGNLSHPSLVILNIDRFREVSNVYGPGIGDSVLRAFAYNLANYLHPNLSGHKVYRLHGDEFAVLANIPLEYDARLKIFQHFYHTVVGRKYRMPDEKMITFRVRMGVAYGDPVELFNRAEIALRMARDTNTSVVPFNEAEDLSYQYQHNIERTEMVKNALEDGRIVPFFHAIVDSASNQIEKYEVLARLVDDGGSVVMMPDEFIPILKRARLYNRFTIELLQKAIDIAKKEEIDISVNISTQDIHSEKSFKKIQHIVAQSHIAKRLHFELLECDSLLDISELTHAILKLKKLGCRVGLDDLGKEYSNFDRLTSLPVDFVKLDRSVMPNVSTDGEALAIAEDIIRFARRKRISTVAEFCSTEELCDVARAMGIEFIQGFYLAEPSADIVRTLNGSH